MTIKKNFSKTGSEYTVTYSDMRGVDFSRDTENTKRYRFSELENMYKDYENGGAGIIESVPGFRKLYAFRKKIHAIYTHKDSAGEEYAVVHAKDNLFRFKISDRDNLSDLTSIGTVKDTKSRAFVFGTDLYILDGENITRVSGDGKCSAVGDDTDAPPYIPTTYFNGEEYEQRNLLTNKFKEKYRIGAAGEITSGTEGVKYTITSETDFLCAVSGISAEAAGVVSIPSFVDISGARYKVAEIADNAFYMNQSITSVFIPTSVTRIGKSAFYGCLNLVEAVMQSGTEIIDNSAFFAAKSLTSVYLGANLKKIGVAAFSACDSLTSINYSADEDSFAQIENYANLSGIAINCGVGYDRISVEIPIYSPALQLYSVTLNGEETEYSVKIRGSFITAIIISRDDKSELDGREVEVLGLMDGASFTKNSVGTNFLSENPSSINGIDAIRACTVAESFDGRIFLSGNAALPNTVFYTSRDLTGRNNPLYFGILNYFNDGVGAFGVESMLAAGDSLAVFKSGDDGSGSIYYHTPRETGIGIMPKIYPVSYIHSGISAVGDSISFFDDPIFLSSLGVCALDKKAINLERSIAVRSHNINPKLFEESLSEIQMAKWCGYLVLMAGSHFYLADSRQVFTHATGNAEYEWYMLTDVGTYLYDEMVFRFSPFAPEGFHVHEAVDEIVCTDVYLATTDGGVTSVLFTEIDGIRYSVYTEKEYRNGLFTPATCICSADGNLLLFGTEGGHVCVFNNDKRGEPPPHLEENDGFDADDYRKCHKGELHPYYYSFGMHAPRYVLATCEDNGNLPHLTKSTVKHSMAVKIKRLGQGVFSCDVRTDNSGYKEIARLPDGALDFGELDFSRLSFENTDYTAIALGEKEKGWIEKSIAFHSDSFASPFGVCSITYRFKIKGRIKNQKG